MRSYRPVRLAVISAVGLMAAGAMAQTATEARPEPQGQSAQGTWEYVLQNGDIIDLKFYYHPELKRSVRNKKVVVLRNQATREPLFLTVDLAAGLHNKGQIDDIPLMPRDIGFVPKTRIARINDFVDQYIQQILPISVGFGFTYVLGDAIAAR